MFTPLLTGIASAVDALGGLTGMLPLVVMLMNKAFDGVGINRDEVYIANIVKCRPPNNRNPELDEVNSCLNYLRNQVMIILLSWSMSQEVPMRRFLLHIL